MENLFENTGTIGRLAVCTGTRLHLVKPLGFSLEQSRVRRAGLDYWPEVDLVLHDNWDDFLQNEQPTALHFVSVHGRANVYECPFNPGDYLVFGNESTGLPSSFYQRYADNRYYIPMPGSAARSHNLANAVSIVVYEALRQLNGW